MTFDIERLNEVGQIKPCETCKCLTCKCGQLSQEPCPNGVNCSLCMCQNFNMYKDNCNLQK